MVPPLLKRAFMVAAVVAAAAEGAVIYQQWPRPPLKICASVELGELLAAERQKARGAAARDGACS